MKWPARGEEPTRRQVRAARERTGLTQAEAAALIYCSASGWQQWELGQRRMHPAFFELFVMYAGLML